jgi:hypothetical protein
MCLFFICPTGGRSVRLYVSPFVRRSVCHFFLPLWIESDNFICFPQLAISIPKIWLTEICLSELVINCWIKKCASFVFSFILLQILVEVFGSSLKMANLRFKKLLDLATAYRKPTLHFTENSYGKKLFWNIGKV